MKNSVLLIAFILTFTCLFSQNRQDYYVSIKPEFALGAIQKTTNPDETLTFSMNNTGFATFLNAKPVYYFEKAFPTAVLEKNKRVYRVTLNDTSHLSDFFNREEVAYIEIVEELEIELSIPNDYEYIDRDGPNTALELIKAPLAWNITSGNPNILIGIQDIRFNFLHEDIVNKIIVNQNYPNNYNSTSPHGSMVASVAAAQTDNSKGIASIGYNSNLAIRNGSGINNTLLLSQESGVKVINISLLFSCSFSQAAADLFEEIWIGNELYPPVVLVAAAGNSVYGNNCGNNATNYVYPAAYDHVIAVSSSGHLVPRGTEDIFYDYGVSWEDLFYRDINDPLTITTHNDKVDLSAPGIHLYVANTGTDNYRRDSGTSLASPMVTGVVALMLDVNPNLTSNEVRDILKNTADNIYHIPENTPYIGLMGTGRLNAYRAVLTAQCMANPTPGLDLMVRNSVDDYGEEPDDNSEILWKSTDIWVRNQNDGRAVRTHQNPEYGQANYIYVRVTNRSCVTSSPSDVVNLYWAKASTGNGWPDLWMGDVPSPVPLGGPVSTLSIPELEPGQEAILEFEWYPPDPEDYHEITSDNWHFCLLAMIDSNEDPLSISGNIQKNSNNIALKNISVVQTIQSSPVPMPKPSATVIIGNIVGEIGQSFGFEFFIPEGKAAVYEEAEVLITLNENAYNRWEENGSQSEHIEVFNEEERQLLITGNRARLLNMHYPPGEWDVLSLSFNFLTEEVTGRSEFEYYLAQTDSEGVAVGGETFHIIRDPERPHFNAEGNSYKNTSGETEMTAVDIGEPAVYNWYTPKGQLFHSGKEFAFVPDIPGDYLLEVVADTDGHKDYFKLSLSPNQSEDQIVSLSPNPASNTVAIAYQIDGNAGSASLTVASFFGNTNNVYPIDLNDTNQSKNINLTGYPTGHYAVVLTVDGQAVHAKQLIIN